MLEMTCVMFLSKLTVFLIAAPFVVAASSPKALSTTTEQIAAHGSAVLIWVAVIIAPPTETILLQMFPIMVLSLFTRSIVTINLGSTLVFSYFHFDEGLINALSMLPVGIILAATFLRFQREKSGYKNYLYSIIATTALHAIHNGIAVGLYLTLAPNMH